MSIKCTLLGHKLKHGIIDNYGELHRCRRCNKQIVYTDERVLQRTLKGRAKGKRRFAGTLGPVFCDSVERLKKDAEVFEKAAELIGERLNKKAESE